MFLNGNNNRYVNEYVTHVCMYMHVHVVVYVFICIYVYTHKVCIHTHKGKGIPFRLIYEALNVRNISIKDYYHCQYTMVRYDGYINLMDRHSYILPYGFLFALGSISLLWQQKAFTSSFLSSLFIRLNISTHISPILRPNAALM